MAACLDTARSAAGPGVSVRDHDAQDWTAPSPAQHARAPRVLVLADDPRLGRWLESRLCACGFKVAVTASVQDALSAASGHAPELIVVAHAVARVRAPWWLRVARSAAQADRGSILALIPRGCAIGRPVRYERGLTVLELEGSAIARPF